jgi:cation diffusion facilitator family transporter
MAALIGNGAIAVAKLLAGLVSGSVSIMAEAAHSMADTFNQVFLLIGLKQAERPADALHPFGYGKARFFWSFVTAVMLFVMGGFFSVYEGLHKLTDHAVTEFDPFWGYVVLSVAFVFEAVSLAVAIRAAAPQTKKSGGFLKGLKKTSNVTLLTVIFEDTAALIGLALAFFGLFLSERLNNPAIDGMFSIMIGILLFGVAIFIARISRDYLLGRGVRPEVHSTLERIISSHPAIVRVHDLLTMYISPDDVLVVAHVNVVDKHDTEFIEKAIDEIERELQLTVPEVKYVFIEPEAAKDRVL